MITLSAHQRRLELKIVDDGVGFSPASATDGHGLANLRHRASALGGEARIASAPGAGTTVILSIDPPRFARFAPMTASATYCLWLIEDNALFRRTVARIVEGLPGVSSAHGFGNCEDALRRIEQGERPDTVLIDVGLPGMDGIEGIRQIKALLPTVQILVLTVFEDDQKIFRAICAGASGYLLKSASMQEIADAVAEVRRGGSPMTPRVARRVLEMFSKLAPAQNDYGLGPREREVLELYVKGFTNKEVAEQLSLSVHTVDSYNKSLYEKLHVNTRSGAVAKALKERLV